MTPLDQALFATGLFVSGLCLAFFYRTSVELRRIDAEAERRSAQADEASAQNTDVRKENP